MAPNDDAGVIANDRDVSRVDAAESRLQTVGKVKRRAWTGLGIGFWLAAFWIALLIVVAVFAPVLPFRSYKQPDFNKTLVPPFHSFKEPLGTDELGRSMLSRVVWGARVSLAVGVFAVGIGMVVGTTIGVLAGYFRGVVDRIITVVADAMIAFPPLVLLLAMVTIFERSLRNIVIALAILIVPSFIRLARANTFVVAEREFVTAAKVMGASRLRILTREILPNVLITLLAYAPVVIALAIIAEGSLAFLGLSLPPPTPSWGKMINDGRSKLDTALHLTYVPGAFMVLTVLSFNWLGRGLHAVYDPRRGVL
jgi:peptide/nickel transport system permease protein